MKSQNEGNEFLESINGDLTICINCHRDVDENYCANCGQKVVEERLRIKSLFSDFLSAIYGLNGKFPRTLIDLVIKPGDVPAEFIKGNRVKYLSPISYFFIIYAILLIVQWVLGTTIFDAIQSSAFGESMDQLNAQNVTSERAKELQEGLYDGIPKYQQYISLFSFLIYGLIAKWFYGNSGFNYIENVIIICYFQAQALFIMMVILIIYKFTGYFSVPVNWLLSSCYLTFAILTVYKYNRLWLAVIKAFVFLIAGTFGITLIAMVIGFAVGAIGAFTGLISA